MMIVIFYTDITLSAMIHFPLLHNPTLLTESVIFNFISRHENLSLCKFNTRIREGNQQISNIL